MPIFGKDAQQRLNDTYDYIKTVDRAGGQRVQDWVVNGLGHFSAATISDALSLGFGATIGTKDTLRDAVRATMLCRIASDKMLSSLNVTSAWKKAYLKKSQSELNTEIALYLSMLASPITLPVTSPTPTPKPSAYGASGGQSYGVSAAQLSGVTLKTVATPAKTPTQDRIPVETSGGNFKNAIKHFDDISRNNVVLSGHGSWETNSAGGFDKVLVGKHQEVRFYIDHFYPLGNDVGQLVDSYQFPAPKQVYGPNQMVPNYTLHFKDNLTLMNNSKGDTRFLTVPKGTTKLLSEFLAMPEYAATTFHFAACRVVMKNGQVACPVHNTWEPYTGNPPHPCVLR